MIRVFISGHEDRILRPFGERIMFLSRLLDLPHKEVHLYKKGSKDWDQDFLDLLNIAKGSERIVLHAPGERPNGNHVAVSNAHLKPLDPEAEGDANYFSINWDKLTYNKKILDNIDFNKTICWSARVSVSPRGPRTDLDKVPDSFLEKYSDFNFINIGMPVSHPRPNWRSVWKKGAYKHPYDLHTTAWIIKKSHKYIGIDAGGTHFALAIKDPTKDILYLRYASTYNGGATSPIQDTIIRKGVTVCDDLV